MQELLREGKARGWERAHESAAVEEERGVVEGVRDVCVVPAGGNSAGKRHATGDGVQLTPAAKRVSSHCVWPARRLTAGEEQVS